ncbi:MAG: bifunctional D-glycero-beta-D-manno-heptose-7-phosphate kinase/D-glycero-beta-D-manno-heptose 1-phosphate adenylyltransferase HldE [Gammaproteobacteria bacterium]|nr:bifunctional D-glycero-beta-D-manno-heptose-7-phosphate kinase/D-glycero-beta-D-manno-heptose 1-phosphate adenylyltransferase HldE [Gammaproteobacteria bacterium]
MLTENMPDFSRGRVLVVGDLMLDRYWHGDTARISPEAPVPVVQVRQSEERAGGAGNVALNLVALGTQTALIAVVGDDEHAKLLQQLLHRAAVTAHLHTCAGRPTITKLRLMSRHQQLIRVDFEDPYDDPELVTRLQATFVQQLSDCDVVVLSDYNKGTLRGVQQLIAAARAANKPVVVDPKGSDFSRYQGATLLTPNTAELEAVIGRCADEADLLTKAEALRRQLALQALLITRSERGVLLLQEGHDPLPIPTHARDVYDVTGAGDTVVSVLAAALAAGETLTEATILANVAAGVVVGKMGTATVSQYELQRALRHLGSHAHENSVVSEAVLLQLVAEARAHHEVVVMTNGCFDILHSGHVTYLQEAARRGDRLIVAVNDDASVRRLKGSERPVNSQAERMQVLAALDCVDWVVGFNEDTPTRLICAVLPDVLVKGGDNDPDKIPGGECVRAAGGRVEIMSYLANISTTNIIAQIRRKEYGE